MKKRSGISWIILLALIICLFSQYDEASAKSKVSETVITNKLADKAFKKKLKTLYRNIDDEWIDEDTSMHYIFMDLTGDGIDEAIFCYRHYSGGSGGYEFAVYSYIKKRAKCVLTEGGNPDFCAYRDSKTLVVFDGKRGWEWYDCYKFTGKKYKSVGSSKRITKEYASDYNNSEAVLSDEEYYSVINKKCSGDGIRITYSDLKSYKENRLKNTEYKGENFYTAYLTLLEGEKEMIDKYNWQRGYYGYGQMTENMIPKPIVIADIYGDGTPELIYFKYNDYYGYQYADMYIVTYKAGNVKMVINKGCADALTAGRTSYYLFKLKDQKQLYLFEEYGDEYWDGTYYLFEENDIGLTKTELYNQRCTYFEYKEYDCTKNGSEKISLNEFNKAVSTFEGNTESILMFNVDSDFVSGFVSKHGCLAMTCDEAIAYLKSFSKSVR